jgi:hypothetical protein
MEKGTVDMEPRLQLLMMGGNVTRVRVDTRFNRSIKSIIEPAHSKDPFRRKGHVRGRIAHTGVNSTAVFKQW